MGKKIIYFYLLDFSYSFGMVINWLYFYWFFVKEFMYFISDFLNYFFFEVFRFLEICVLFRYKQIRYFDVIVILQLRE